MSLKSLKTLMFGIVFPTFLFLPIVVLSLLSLLPFPCLNSACAPTFSSISLHSCCPKQLYKVSVTTQKLFCSSRISVAMSGCFCSKNYWYKMHYVLWFKVNTAKYKTMNFLGRVSRSVHLFHLAFFLNLFLAFSCITCRRRHPEYLLHVLKL